MKNTTEYSQATRNRVIVRTSVIGILANTLLAGFKAAVGVLSGSIAVVLDAVNNLSDVLSSVITIVGTKLAANKPDKKHPLGYGRIEYLSAMIVASLVLYAGITSAIESVKKIFQPVTPDYSAISLVIIGSAVVVKILLGTYVKSQGKKVNSGALVASGSDALFDSVISLSVLVSAFIFIFTGISLEAYVGVIISAVITKAGIAMLIESLDEILGKRADRELVDSIKKTVCENEHARGAYDLFLHSYGPDMLVGSVHVEVTNTLTADKIDVMERQITQSVMEKHGVLLTGIGIYSVNTAEDEINQLRKNIINAVNQFDGILQIHGFYVDTEKKSVSFDVILDFKLRDRQKTFEEICENVKSLYPDYQFDITLDIDV